MLKSRFNSFKPTDSDETRMSCKKRTFGCVFYWALRWILGGFVFVRIEIHALNVCFKQGAGRGAGRRYRLLVRIKYEGLAFTLALWSRCAGCG